MAYYKKKANPKNLIKAIERMPQEEIKSDLTKFLPFTHRNIVVKIKEMVLEKLRSIS